MKFQVLQGTDYLTGEPVFYIEATNKIGTKSVIPITKDQAEEVYRIEEEEERLNEWLDKQRNEIK